MPAIGEPFIRTVSIAGSSSIVFTADTGEKWKVTMAYAKTGGSPDNDLLAAAPATGNESTESEGTVTGQADAPPIGSHTNDGGSRIDQLQPVFIDDTSGLYLGNGNGATMNVVVQGVRVA